MGGPVALSPLIGEIVSCPQTIQNYDRGHGQANIGAYILWPKFQYVSVIYSLIGLTYDASYWVKVWPWSLSDVFRLQGDVIVLFVLTNLTCRSGGKCA